MRKKLYRKLLELLFSSNSGHIGSCLSCMDILIELLIVQLKKGDKFILSKGHAIPAVYVIFNYLKIISDSELLTFLKDNTVLPAHPPPNRFLNVMPFHSGSLGHGLSLSCGIAEAVLYKTNKSKKISKIYCLLSDGECNEGQVWEAAQYAVKRRLTNLVVMIDKNGLQALDKTANVLGDSTKIQKWKAFGFEVFETEGHNIKKIKKIFNRIRRSEVKKPKVVIFNTVKGYGVSFMQNSIDWHYNKMNKSQFDLAIAEVNKKL